MITTRKFNWRLSVCAAALSFSLAPGVAQAQLPELLVTAQKRAEGVQSVPISISAYSGDFIRESGIDSLQDLSFYAPNLYLSKSSQVANQRIAIRGVGSVGNNAIEPSVAVFVDGVYIPRPSAVVGNLQDIETVEVLRGPQGTLFGRNASMGALNIRTKLPTDEFEGEIRGKVGNYDLFSGGATLSGPVSDKVSARLAFDYSDRGGYGDNDLNGEDISAWEDLALSGKVNIRPNDAWNITLSADYHSVENDGPIVEIIPESVEPAFLAQAAAFLDPSGLAGQGTTFGSLGDVSDAFDWRVNQTHEDTAEDDQWGVAADISWDVGDHTVRSITSYREWQNDTFESAIRLPLDLIDRVTDYDTETFSQEIQLLSPTGQTLEYVAGLYYYDETYSVNQDLDAGDDFCIPLVQNFYTATFAPAVLANPLVPDAFKPAFISGGITDAVTQCLTGAQQGANASEFEQDLESIAIYGQATVNLSDAWSVTGGLRWTKDEKSGSFVNTVNNPLVGVDPLVLSTGLPGLLSSALVPSLDLRIDESATNLEQTDEELTWLANVQWDVNDDVMLYAVASTGFKSGGFNSESGKVDLTALGLRTFDKETTQNYELGVKSRLFDGRVTANLSVFQTEIDDFQDRSFDGLSFIVRNAGELRQRGIELDLQAQPVEQWFIGLGAGLLDSEFQDFREASALPGTPITLVDGVPRQLPQDLTGTSNHFSPELQLSLVSQWSDQFANSDMGWFVRGEWQYIDEQNVGANTNNNAQSIQDAYDLFNARVGIQGADNSWELALWGRNLGDEGYCQTIFDQPLALAQNNVTGTGPAVFTNPTTGSSLQRCVVGAPQTWGVEAAFRF